MKTYLSIISLFILFVSIIILSGYQTEGSMSCSAPDIVVSKPNDGEKINSSNVDISFEVKSNGTSKIDKSSLSVKVVSSGGVKDVKSSLSESCNLLVTDCNYSGSVNLGEDNYTLKIDVCDSGNRCSNKSVSFSVDLPEEVNISITSVQPEDGEVILYSSNTNIVVGVSGGEGVGVRVGNYIATQMGRGRYVVRGYPLNAGINEVEIVAESGNNRVTRKVRYENLRVIGDGRVKASEGGIVMAEFDKDVELRIRANSLDRDTEVKIKRWGVGTNNRLGVIAGGGIEVDLGGARLRSDAELRMRYIGELLDAGGSESGYLRIYRDGESAPVESQFENDEVVVGRISGGGRYYVMTEIQNNMGMRAVAGMGEVEPSEDLRDGSEIRFPSEIKSMKRDGNGNVYILSGDKVYKYLPDGNTIKRILDLSGVQGGIGEPVSIGVTGDGRSLYVAYALGYIYRYDISGGVGAGVKVNAVDGAEEPRDGGLLKRTLFIMPRGLEILEATSEGVKMIVVDSGKRKVYMVEDGGVGEVWEVAGSGWSKGEDTDDPIDAKKVELDIPASGEVVVVNDRKVLFFADRLGHRVRAINLNSHTVNLYGIDLPPGYIMTVAGKKCNLPIFLKMFCGGYSGDGGKGRDALLKYPSYVSYDRDEEVLYIMDSGNKVVRALTKSGYITTIGGGGDEVDESKSAVMNKINKPGPIVHTIYKKRVEIEGTDFYENKKTTIFVDENIVKNIDSGIGVILVKKEGFTISQVSQGEIRWDENTRSYKGDSLIMIVTFERRGFNEDYTWYQVLCREGLTTKYIGGVFNTTLGCNKFGGDYISSYKYEFGDGEGQIKVSRRDELYEVQFIMTPIKRDSPGSNRFYFKAYDYKTGKVLRERTFDVPFVLDKKAVDIGPGIQIGSTIYEADLSDPKDPIYTDSGLKKEDVDYLCPDGCVPGKNCQVDVCYLDNKGLTRSPTKFVLKGGLEFPEFTECSYYFKKVSEPDVGVTDKIFKTCVDANRRKNEYEVETDEYKDAQFYNENLTRAMLSKLVDNLLDRMERRGMRSIQITPYGIVTKACNNIVKSPPYTDEYGNKWDRYICDPNSSIETGVDSYPIIAFLRSMDVMDMMIDLIVEKNKNRTKRVLDNIFIKPSLAPRILLHWWDLNYNAKDQLGWGSINSSIGPMTKDSYNRIKDTERWIIEGNGSGDITLWDVNGQWSKVLKKDENKIVTLKGDYLDNLNTGFFTGDIKTCNPLIELEPVYERGSFIPVIKDINCRYLKDFHVDGSNSDEIDGTDCDSQDMAGIYNYYCFLRHSVKKGKEIKDKDPSLDVYISISNDHVAPAIALPYVRIRVKDKTGNEIERDVLSDFKSGDRGCPECKFTNAMVVEQLSWDASVPYNDEQYFWHNGDGNPYLYKKTTFDTLIQNYINYPTFGDTGFGINAYAPGNCIDREEKWSNDKQCERFCYLYVGGDDVSKSYIDSIYCSNRLDCLRFMDDINKGKSRIFTNTLPVIFKYPPENKICQWLYYDQNGNPNVNECGTSYIDIGQRVCVDSLSCKGNFYEIDPPLNTESCAGIYRCKDNYYEKYLGYIRNLGIDSKLFISEIGSLSSEYASYSTFNVSEFSGEKMKEINIYGATNIKDYQEQVDMVEGDIMVFLGDDYLRQNKKLKGVIIFSDDLLPAGSQLFWYNFPPTGKPLDKFIPLLTGKGVK